MTTPQASAKASVAAFNEPDGPSFSDLLDILNPLQHIPIISTIYRQLSGDDEGAVADVVGGTLYGGPLGLIASLIDLAVQDGTGKRIGDNVVALFDSDDTDNATSVADTGSSPKTDTPEATPSQAAPIAPQALGGDADGPILAGDYFVFGGAPIIVAQAETKPATPTAPAHSDQLQKSGDFIVFGDSAASQPAETTQIGRPGMTEAKAFSVPNRTGPATPRQVLPRPTTGPGALPGGHSVATTAGSTSADPDNGWFVNSFNQAMDKYQQASRLGQISPAAAQ